MKTISRYILINLLGWRIAGEFPNFTKSVIIFAPHTSYWDGFYGKLYLMQLHVNYKFLSKKEFFKFPLKYFFKHIGSIPVYKNKAFVDYVAKLFDNCKELHIVLSPEGQLAKTTHWKKGYYYIAVKANVPILVGYIDYRKKEIGIKGIVHPASSIGFVRKVVSELYSDVSAKYPERFSIETTVKI